MTSFNPSSLIKLSPLGLHDRLVNVISTAKKGFVVIGGLLYYLHKRDMWMKVAGGLEEWTDYLAQPEIGLSKGEASRLMQIYEQFVVRLGYSIEEISEIPVKNLHRLLPVVKKEGNRDKIDNMIADAKVLSQKDFRERLYDHKTNETGERTYEYLIMRKCVQTGTMERVHSISSDEIKKAFNLNHEH